MKIHHSAIPTPFDLNGLSQKIKVNSCFGQDSSPAYSAVFSTVWLQFKAMKGCNLK